jgi:hypothetical protein
MHLVMALLQERVHDMNGHNVAAADEEKIGHKDDSLLIRRHL